MIKAYESKSKFDTKNNILGVNNYDNAYLYGNFTKIFSHYDTNSEIANKLETIPTKLKAGKPVFLMGYGASGAGKTSALIFFKIKDTGKTEDGILTEICKQMAKDYTTINVKVEEYYIDTTVGDLFVNNPDNNYTDVCSKANCNGFKVITDGTDKQFSFDDNNTWKEVPPSRVGDTDKPGDDESKNPMELGEYLVQKIDEDRKVGATTNNPNSSRSHVLVYITFISKTNSEPKPNPPVFIIGDFAGVENKFDCNSGEVLSRFALIERDNPKEGQPKIFYNDKATCEEIVKIAANKTMSGGGGGGFGPGLGVKIPTSLEKKNAIWEEKLEQRKADEARLAKKQTDREEKARAAKKQAEQEETKRTDNQCKYRQDKNSSLFDLNNLNTNKKSNQIIKKLLGDTDDIYQMYQNALNYNSKTRLEMNALTNYGVIKKYYKTLFEVALTTDTYKKNTVIKDGMELLYSTNIDKFHTIANQIEDLSETMFKDKIDTSFKSFKTEMNKYIKLKPTEIGR